MTVEADFTVVGKNYWELDREAQRVIDSLVGDLVDQRADYSIHCTPKVEVHGEHVPIMWEGSVRLVMHQIPDTIDYNRRR